MLKNKREQYAYLFTVFVVIVSFSWAVFPMLLLRENYCFTIHDGMDSYAGIVQMLHENGLYFHLNQALPIMNGLDGKYTFLSYTLYDFLNCSFGYLWGQIFTRIIGVILGFFSLKHLLEHIYLERTRYQSNIILLLSAAYIVTPVAPNRMIGFASLPLVIDVFLNLRSKEKISKIDLFGLLFPVLSIFDAVFIFVLGFWFLFGIIDRIIKRKASFNIWITFILMCVSTLLTNINFFKVAISAEDTNRGLAFGECSNFSFNWRAFKGYLLNGQYHSSAYQNRVLLPVLAIGTIAAIYLWKRSKDTKDRNRLPSLFIISAGWFLWIVSALVETCQESGLRTGILIIDGFQWGRVIGIMRVLWFLMFAAVMFLTSKHFAWKVFLYVAICVQLINVALIKTTYNDTFYSVANEVFTVLKGERPYISYKEFFSEELFNEIKKDINYDGEGVAAYGYHPSVLLFNNFNTVDGYFSVHSMDWQNQFREIIKPELDRDESNRLYYDSWGGKMYLFGPLSYLPTKEKNIEPTKLYIDVDAYRKYGGQYILSRAAVSNADDLGLIFVKDYDLSDSIYHIYLYRVE